MEIREGDALQTLVRDLPNSIDLVLLDGAKSLYSPILSLLEGRLGGGALIVADNADDSPEYLTRVRSAAGNYLSVPFADDVELSMRLAAAAPGDGSYAHVLIDEYQDLNRAEQDVLGYLGTWVSAARSALSVMMTNPSTALSTPIPKEFGNGTGSIRLTTTQLMNADDARQLWFGWRMC